MTVKVDRKAFENALRACYADATRKGGLIEFTHEIRGPKNDLSGKYSVSQKDLAHLFSATVWKEVAASTGHRKLENIVTHIVIEYANHDNKGGIDPGAALTILNAVQEHLNILCNDIFAYNYRNWKHEPDYPSSIDRLLKRIP